MVRSDDLCWLNQDPMGISRLRRTFSAIRHILNLNRRTIMQLGVYLDDL